MFSENPHDRNLSYLAQHLPTVDARWAILVAGCRTMAEAPEASHPVHGAHSLAHHDGAVNDYLLHMTLQRLRELATPHRTIAVFDRERGVSCGDLVHNAGGQRIFEPKQRGTAASIFVAASYVLEYDPHATLLIHPPDHVVHPEARFQGYLMRLCLLSELFHDQVVMLGAAPMDMESEHSWVMPGGVKSPSLWVGAGPNPLGMVTYYDRPSGEDAQRLFQEGGLLNTGICAVKVKTLWKLGWDVFPERMQCFDSFRRILHGIKNDDVSPAHEEPALDHLYERLSTVDFSTDFLQRAADHITVLPMDDVAWSDWRSPARMREILLRAGSSPASGLRRQTREVAGQGMQRQ